MFLDLAGVVIVAFAASLLACRIILITGPIDAPTEARKAHTAPTPTSGGVGIGVGVAAGMFVLSVFSNEWRHEVNPEGVRLLWISGLYALPLLIIGYIDDARHLDARLKFAAYTAIAIAAAWTLGVVDVLPLGEYQLRLPFFVALLGTALWVFTLLNAVNFMDGANGLAMGSTAVGLLALAAIAWQGEAWSGVAITICAAAALAGFLVWNYPSGRLFAGDSGALFAGAIAAFASLIVIARAGLSPFVPPLVFLPLLADVLLTLFHRARQGRSLLEPHREHLYQIVQTAGVPHSRVAPLYWMAMAVCGVIAYLASFDPAQSAPSIALAALAGVAVAIDLSVRRWAKARNPQKT